MEKSKFDEGFEEVPVPLEKVTFFYYVNIVFIFRNTRFFCMSQFYNFNFYVTNNRFSHSKNDICYFKITFPCIRAIVSLVSVHRIKVTIL